MKIIKRTGHNIDPWGISNSLLMLDRSDIGHHF